ncbi:MAG TPA: YggU family protein [Clostridia bacterium]|jgi:uncharacterized protein (TIGR00251 family)|nr:DUF167 domain-containing protein [Clostridia bacterium]HHY05820.1 YggU family protein [Clostridia bacterium]
MSAVMVTKTPGGIKFKVKVQPRASRNEITGWQGDALKVRLTAPPVDGEANQACLKFLAAFFQVARRQVNITSGLKGRTKTIEITGLTVDEFKQCLKDKNKKI